MNMQSLYKTWLRRPVLGALVPALLVTGVLLLNFFWVRQLQDEGRLDRVAVVLNAVCTLVALPGIIVGRILFLVRHHFPGHALTLYFLTSSLVTGLVVFAFVFVRLKQRQHIKRQESPSPESDADPGRRRFLRRTVAGALMGSGAGVLGVYGVFVEPVWPRLRRLTWTLPGLPPALDGLRVLHLTDLHLGRFNSAAYLRAVVDQGNALAPDLVVLTGDYVHGSSRFVEPVAAIMGRLRSRFGSIGVLGNHDHWEGTALCKRALAHHHIRLVDNRHLWLGPSGLVERRPTEGGLVVCGVGDYWEDARDLDAALGGVDPSAPRLLLGHNPDYAEDPVARSGRYRVDLMLAGHTHGGQVRLPGTRGLITPSLYGTKYASGLVQGPAFPVHVSTGVGVTILPVRLLVRPELVLLTLRARPQTRPA